MEKEPPGWHSRGYLPHFDGGEIAQFVTLRLCDSVPASVIDRWKLELQFESEKKRASALYRRIETYIDQGYGACYLKNPLVSYVVEKAMLHFDGSRYQLSAWVLMPNHIHFVLIPCGGWELSNILHSIKSFTAQKANRILNRNGKFWQEDYFDRFIRNDRHFVNVIAYIENNPLKAGLCKLPKDWRFSSARRQSE